MAVGDQNDMLTRLKAALPNRWFGDVSPFRDAVLSGFANVLSSMYGLIQYAKAQTRIATATDGFLDLISFDFFGLNLLRKSGEADNPFRARILATLLREKATRKGIIATLVALTAALPLSSNRRNPATAAPTGSARQAMAWPGITARCSCPTRRSSRRIARSARASPISPGMAFPAPDTGLGKVRAATAT